MAASGASRARREHAILRLPPRKDPGVPMTPSPGLDDARALLRGADELLARAVEAARRTTGGGSRIDEHQVLVEAVAYAATEGRAAGELLAAAARAEAEGRATPMLAATAAAGVADLVRSLRVRLEPHVEALGLGEEALDSAFPASLRALLRRVAHESVFRAIGEHVARTRGRNATPLDEVSEQVRDAVREFAEREVAPHAERIHRRDELVPEEFIAKMAELGYFGLAIPEEYGGSGLGNLAMILTTEELSRGSLAAAGSLITRPEILTKALVQGGSAEQKRHWLPKIAAGELMVGISVTEPDVGSDVASVKCRAERARVDGRDVWSITGPKAWCTFAGRADVLAVLCRTDPDPSKGAKGLSLFIVPKEPSGGHAFELKQPGGGRLVGKADATPGYRGMHSFTLAFERYLVPAENLIGGPAGEGRGFYLQMAGFAAGRLQTGGRACGLAQAALEKTAEYVEDRRQFGRKLSDYGLTRHTLGRMAASLAASRAITYAAAREIGRAHV